MLSIAAGGGKIMSMLRRNRREGGASLVEFALILPLLTLFLFGIVQFGLAYDRKQSINSAAREGARMAAIPDDTVNYASIENRVNASFDSLVSGTVDSVTIGIFNATDPPEALPVETFGVGNTESPCKDHPGKTVRVTAVKKHKITIPFFGEIEPDLTGKGEFRCEVDQ
jgi:hypothetical protein